MNIPIPIPLIIALYIVGLIVANIIAMNRHYLLPPLTYNEKIYRFGLTFIWPIILPLIIIYIITYFFTWPWRD